MGLLNDIVSQARIFIDGPMGSFQLVRVESFSVDDQSSAEVTTAMGVRGGAGVRYKEGGGGITLSVFREQGDPEVNWLAVKEAHLRFAITIQDTGGQRTQYFCGVSDVTRKDDDKGSHMDEVKLFWTGRPRILPTLPI